MRKTLTGNLGVAVAEDRTSEAGWMAVIGRSLAYLCMKAQVTSDQSLLDKSRFLEGLGLARGDAAAMLGTTAASISELNRRAKNKKKAKGGRGGK